jgi:hypothetical protein
MSSPHTAHDHSAVIEQLRSYIEAEGFAGYDPYDILNSPLPIKGLGTFAAAVATQLHKRNPVNIRPLLGIKKEHNPKGLGLLLHAYCNLQRVNPHQDFTTQINALVKLLSDCRSQGYKGAAWGYNFAWASPGKFLPRYAPSGVVTAFVAKGLHACYTLTSDPTAKALLIGTAQFILNELPIAEDSTGSCISYTPFKQDYCYNASLLAAETLSRVYAVTGEETLKALSLRAADYVLARQHPDGRWNYSWSEKTGEERRQIDFHQGFVLDSLTAIQHLTSSKVRGGEEAVRRGLEFYRQQQFTADGRALWRYPKSYPTDIHNQAQGIITFARHGDAFAGTIADWTINAMFNHAKGYFYYRKYPNFTNTIPYMRWSNAWMLLALSEYALMKSKGSN